MTYSAGGLIQATDYNGFVSTNGANINNVWAAGSTDSGWGQTALSSVSAGGIVTATQWASLVNTLSSMGSQTNTTITSRTVPTAGSTITALAAVNTDITNCTTNRGNAAAVGSQYTTGGSASATGETSQFGWTLTFTHSMTFASVNAARYFFNAGGIVQMSYSKTSTGLTNDAEWNAFVAQIGTLNLTGRVNSSAQTIAGTSYTGTTRIGGSGGTQTTLTTTTGYYQLTPGGAAITLMQINNGSAPYTSEYIATTCALNSASTILTFVTTWYQPQGSGLNTSISAGSTTALSYFPPSTTYLTNSWGTPTLSASESQYP
jgi:hypothetical protein